MQDTGPRSNPYIGLAALLSMGFFAGITWMLSRWEAFSATPPQIQGGEENLAALGQALVSPEAYLLPFELASVLLVAALIGAIFVARGENKPQDEEEK